MLTKRNSRLFIICYFLLLCAGGIAAAQSRNEEFPFLRGRSLPATDTLTLDEVLAVVNANHPKLAVARLGTQSAEAAILRAKGALDPLLGIETDAKRQDEKFKSQSFAAEAVVPLYSGQKIIGGWKRALGLFDRDAVTPAGGEAYLGISAPLWRNILIDKNRAAIRKAEVLPAAAEAETTMTRNDLFLKASEKFWDWSAAGRKYDVAAQLLSLAEVRAAAIAQEVLRGERAPVDTMEIRQEIQRRLGNLSKARREFEKAAIALSVFLWQTDGSPAQLAATVVPPTLPAELPRLTAAQYRADRENAVTRRPEIAVLAAESAAAGIEAEFANEQWKPDINLKLMPFSQNFSGSFDYKVGLDFSMPLLLRDARGQILAAEVKTASVDWKRRMAQREVQAEVDDAASDVIAALEQAQAAGEERIAAAALEQSERELFQNGESNLFTVNFRERFTAEAQAKEADAIASYFKALYKFRYAAALF